MAILMFITGGTIDKAYKGPPHAGYEQQKTFIHDMLVQCRVDLFFRTRSSTTCTTPPRSERL